MFGKSGKFLLVFILILAWIFSGWPQIWKNPSIPPKTERVFAETQAKTAGTAASTKDGGGYADCDDIAWAFEGADVQADLLSADGSEIYITSPSFDDGNKSYTIVLSNFGFDLPTNSTIDGIVVSISRRSLGGADGKDYHLQLTKSAGTPVAGSDDNADTTTVWPASVTAATYGGVDEKWNTTWTEAEIESSGFGLVFAAMAVGAKADIWVDQIQITVHYSPPAETLTAVVSTDTFPIVTPGVAVFATSTIDVNTNSASGWNVTIYGNDQGPSNTVMDLTTNASVGITDQLEWTAGAATSSAGNAVRISSLDNSNDVLAFRVMTASGTASFLASDWWGSVDDYADNANTLWAGVASSTNVTQIGNSSDDSGGGSALNTVNYYLKVPTTQQSGSYSGDITFTTIINP
ncbi:MAG: hypothetical protein KAR00_00530 [Candidatus Pacebacteria bacterium]|nr:hypothetical protein [Candidatus Paceibacterota bacterium]